MAFYGQRKGKRSQQGLGGILQDRFKKKKMNNLIDWIAVGAGLAIGKLLVALVIIAIGIGIVALLIIIDEKSK